jgi:hypothetical protein
MPQIFQRRKKRISWPQRVLVLAPPAAPPPPRLAPLLVARPMGRWRRRRVGRMAHWVLILAPPEAPPPPSPAVWLPVIQRAQRAKRRRQRAMRAPTPWRATPIVTPPRGLRVLWSLARRRRVSNPPRAQGVGRLAPPAAPPPPGRLLTMVRAVAQRVWRRQGMPRRTQVLAPAAPPPPPPARVLTIVRAVAQVHRVVTLAVRRLVVRAPGAPPPAARRPVVLQPVPSVRRRLTNPPLRLWRRLVRSDVPPPVGGRRRQKRSAWYRMWLE